MSALAGSGLGGRGRRVVDHRPSDVARCRDEGARQDGCQERERRRRVAPARTQDERQRDRRRRDGGEAEEGVPLREPLDGLRAGHGTPAPGEVGQVVRPEPARRPRHEAAGDGDGEEERGGREGRGPRARADVGERERPGGEERRGDGEVDDGGMDRKRRFHRGPP